MYLYKCVHEYTHTLAYMMQGDNDNIGADFYEIVFKVPGTTEASSCRVVFIRV